MSLDLALELKERVGTRKALALALDEKLARAQRASFAAPGGLLRFVRHFWKVLEPDVDFVDGWCPAAICEHLEACADGRITRLLINVAPGSAKSLLCSVFFPAWVWGALKRPGARFLCASYSQQYPNRDNKKMVDLVQSPEYRRLYGRVFDLKQSGAELVTNNRTGSKSAIGIGGSVTGGRGDFVVVDDPNNVAEGESEVVRDETNRKFREALSNRLNDRDKSVIIVIQQRSHEDDVSGMILESDMGSQYVHLCIPMLYEPERHCETAIGWSDPRTEDGECYWPERVSPDAIQEEMDRGEFYFAGQCQQRPSPRGGGILKEDYWLDWDPEPNPSTGRREFPVTDFVVASLDPAFTSKEEGDPSGFGVWGCFQSPDGQRGVILLDAFSKRLELCGPEPMQAKDETYEAWRARTRDGWGLIETVFDRCRRFKVDVLLIENKASGLSVIQAMEKLFLRRRFQIQAVDPKGLDKMARAIRIQPEFSGGYIYAPKSKDWAGSVIRECGTFPRGSHDDQVDQTTQAIYWLRTNGFLERKEERFVSMEEAMRKYKPVPALYNV